MQPNWFQFWSRDAKSLEARNICKSFFDLMDGEKLQQKKAQPTMYIVT